MYSINVFLTFSLSQFGMMTLCVRTRHQDPNWKRHIVIHVIGFFLCVTILVVTTYEKFEEGGWVTLMMTSALIGLCYLIRRHYTKVSLGIRQIEDLLSTTPPGGHYNHEPLDPKERTAIMLVSGFNGAGIHSWLSVFREFPKLYKNFIFVSVGAIDSGSFKGRDEVDALKASVAEQLQKYVTLCRSYGFPADFRTDEGTDVVDAATNLIESIVKEFPRSTVFAGQLVFTARNPFPANPAQRDGLCHPEKTSIFGDHGRDPARPRPDLVFRACNLSTKLLFLHAGAAEPARPRHAVQRPVFLRKASRPARYASAERNRASLCPPRSLTNDFGSGAAS